MRAFPLRLLVLGAALTVGVTTIAAQPPLQPRAPRGEARRDARMDDGRGRVFRDITLTQTQRTQLRTVQQKYATQRRELVASLRAKQPQRGTAAGQPRQRPDSAARTQRRTQQAAMRTEMQQLTQRQQTELRAVLTPAQQPTFDRNVAELRQQVGVRGQGRERGKRGERGMRRDLRPGAGKGARVAAPRAGV